MRFAASLFFILSQAALPISVAAVQAAPAPRIDIADSVAGTYFGSVISDARGSSRSDVTITVEKVAPGTVRVTSDYARLPAFTTRIERVADTVQQSGTDVVFLLETARVPQRLYVTVDDAAWAGERQ
jgi:hypothetical protein